MHDLEEYVKLASRNEDLKSEERVLWTALESLKQIKALVLEKERNFCIEDQKLRLHSNPTANTKDSLRKRCFNLIEHLIHYKCAVECILTDTLNMDASLIDDDEYIRLSLTYREVELAILKAIKLNQQRNENFQTIHYEEAQSYLPEIEAKWHAEHAERRRLVSKLITDHNQFIIEKATKNLERQQILLNQRYQSINNLIKMSYGLSGGCGYQRQIQ